MTISVVIVAFKSDHLLENLIHTIPNHFEIIVIENSLNHNLRSNLKKFKNVKVIIPNENLGYGKSFNLGLEISKNNIICFISPDIFIPENCFESLIKLIEKFKDFSILAPSYKNEKIHKNYQIKDKFKLNNLFVDNFKLIEVDEIDFAMALVNKSNISNLKLMDENFFLYFESTDACLSLRKQNKKIYVVENIKFIHHGTSSSDISHKNTIDINRNWHFSWSKFYLFKKHYNYLYGLKKTLPNFIHSLKWFIICKVKLIIFKTKKVEMEANLHQAVLLGLINSYLLKKSSYRPFNNKK